MSAKTPLVLRFVIWTMLLFAFSIGVWSFRLLRPLELKVISLNLLQRDAFSYRSMKNLDLPFLLLPVYGQLSNESYLNLAKEAVHKLKSVGAKAIVVPLPELYAVSPRILRTIQDIAADSIAIFGVGRAQSMGFSQPDDFRLEDRKRWWVGHPLPKQLKIPWGVMSATNASMSPIIRFIPTGFRESNKGEPVSDVALLALKHYFDIPESSLLQPSASRLQVGSTSIQLSREGISYVKFGYTTRRSSEIWAMVDQLSDSARFYASWETKPESEVELQKAWEQHRGKIVFLDWIGTGVYRFPSYGWMYMQFFGSLFDRSFVTTHHEWNVLLITTLVMFFSLFSYTLRNGYTVLLAFVLIGASIVLSVWLLTKYNVLFDPVYIILPTILCGFVFPIVKTSGEKKIAEATIKSLEEENKRLLDLQQRTQTPLPR